MSTISKEDYFESYRKKLREIEKNKSKLTELQLEVKNVRDVINNIQTECVKMRGVITKMIEEGIDDVEARLRDDSKITSLWDYDNQKLYGISSVTATTMLPNQWSTILNGGYITSSVLSSTSTNSASSGISSTSSLIDPHILPYNTNL